jgi:hypothetical protein
MSTANATKQREWLTAAEVRENYEIEPEPLAKLAKANLVTSRVLPGTRPRYSRASIEALLAKHTREAAPAEATV